MNHSGHPYSCWNCITAGVNCSWVIVDSQLLRTRAECDWCDELEIVCEWTAPSPPPKKTPDLSSTTYVKGDDNETEEQRYQRIQAWVCKPDKPSDPFLRALWIANLQIWRNGGNAPLPTQIPIPTPAPPVHPEPLQPSPPPSPSPSIVNLDPPSPPAISSDHENPSPPKKPRNFIHKTSKNQTKNQTKNKNKKFFNHSHSKVFTRKPSPVIVPDSPVEIKPKFSTIIEVLIETPPPSPPVEFEDLFPPSSENITSKPVPSTSSSNDRFTPETYPSITREGIDAFIAEFGPGNPVIALTETIFNLLSSHWKIFTSNNPVELNSRSNLVTAIKNIAALDVVYRAHPRPELRPPHYDGITTGFPPYFPIPPVGHDKFYDDVAKDNFKFSSEGKGKKRARE
ncbi:hypothetical protein DFH28DRAFT_1176860, partial [Melampsora americana]